MGEQVSSCGCNGYDNGCGVGMNNGCGCNTCNNGCGCNNCGGYGGGCNWIWWIIILAIIFLFFCAFGGGWC